MEIQGRFHITSLCKKDFETPKAKSLSYLAQKGFQVPSGYILDSRDKDFFSLNLDKINQNLSFPWVIRSSSFLEDQAQSSYAGQFKTLLNINSPSMALEAFNICSNSMNDFAPELSHQVFIQKQIQPIYSGICFSKSLENRDFLSLEFVQGHLESLTSGQGHGHHVQIHRTNYEIQGAEGLSISTDILFNIRNTCLDIENLFGSPQDIEWAIDQEGLWILQARPLTIQNKDELLLKYLNFEKAKLFQTQSTPIWTDSSIGDVLQNPSPLLMDAFRKGTENGSGIDLAFKSLGLYYNKRNGSADLFEFICGRAYINLNSYLKTLLPLAPFQFFIKDNKISVQFFKNPFKFLFFSVQFSYLILKMIIFSFKENSTLLSRKQLNEFKSYSILKRSEDFSQKSMPELKEQLRFLCETLNSKLTANHLITDILSGINLGLIRLFLQFGWKNRAAELESKLLTGLDGNTNVEINADFFKLSQHKISLSQFMELYGHKGFPDWEPSAKRFRESETEILRIAEKLKNSNFEKIQNNLLSQKQQRIDTLNFIESEKSIFKYPLHHFCKKYYKYSPLRETTQDLCFRWIEMIRKVCLEIGYRSGLNDLIFYLHLSEIYNLSNPSESIKTAQDRFSSLRLLRGIKLPHLLDKEIFQNLNIQETNTNIKAHLSGTPVSNGQVQGKIRHIQNFYDIEYLQTGEIVVSSFLDPSLTPHLCLAGGLILEQGSAFSHGAIIAREMGVPCIVNAPDACHLLQDGAEIVMDGTTGKIEILNEELKLWKK